MKSGIKLSGRTALFTMIAVITFLLIIYSVYTSLLPAWQIRAISEKVSKDEALNKKYGMAFISPELNDQVRQKAYSESFIKASDNDSIFIFIDLVDSVVGLGINGVKIKVSEIGSFRADRMLGALNNLEYISLFSSPLRQEDSHATFEREPVVVKEAPSDTTEALKNLSQPELPKLQPAFVSMGLSNNVLLVMNQVKTGDGKEGLSRLKFNTSLSLKSTAAKLTGLLTLSKDAYIFRINITIPAEDIYEIYRAFPPGGNIILRIPGHNKNKTLQKS